MSMVKENIFELMILPLNEEMINMMWYAPQKSGIAYEKGTQGITIT